MPKKAIISKGLMYLFFYVIISAVSNVFINHATRSIEPIVAMFYSSIVTIIFFSILNLGELTENIALVKENKNSILWLNLLNAIIFIKKRRQEIYDKKQMASPIKSRAISWLGQK